MSAERLLLSDKYKAFLRCDAPVEFLEGTTAAGKTTVGLFKFMLKVAESPKKLHIIAAKDTGTAEKNIINKDLGIMDDFGVLVEYNGNGTKDDKIPHILFHTSGGDKVIYVMGYGDKKKWQKALGGQYGCLYIDEINTADIDFVREAAMRCDYLMATLNPDDPSLPVYKEYINCSRPLPEWEEETPQEIKDELKEEPKHGWVHWFFSFAHNLGLPKEKLDKILANTPKGTKIWKNKIQGLRGKATGLVFSNFNRKVHVKSKEWAKQFVQASTGPKKQEFFMYFSAGIDTSYSQKSPDTIALSFIGMWHMKQAENFRKRYGEITRENYGKYIENACKEAKKTIDRAGITEYNVSDISSYADQMFWIDRYDEVEAEYMVKHRRGKKHGNSQVSGGDSKGDGNL